MTPSLLALGVDVGGTAIKTVLATENGVRVLSREDPTPTGGAQEVIEAVSRIVAQVRAQVASGQVRTDGQVLRPEDVCEVVGVDMPGVVDESTGTAVLSVNLGWRDFPMRQRLEEALGCPVVYGHDVRSGAWAECRWGAGSPNSLYLALGTGIASVVVVDGHTVVSGGWAGEVGQMLLPDPDHPGSRERFEAIASAGGMTARLAACRPEEDREAVVAAGALGVQHAMEAGDPQAIHVWETALDAQADVIAGIVCVLGPLDVVIGGGLVKAGEDLLLEPLRRRVADRLVVAPVPTISPAGLGSWAQALGSAGRALEAAGI